LALGSWPAAADVAPPFRLLTYHDQPPYVTASGAGLTYDLARYLAARLSLGLIPVDVLPRKRLDEEILARQDGFVVPWINPSWFAPAVVDRMRLTKAILSDRNLVISAADAPVTYTTPADLIGHRYASVTGRKQIGIDPLVAQGRIERVDVRTVEQTIDLLRRRRVDFIVIPRTTWVALVDATDEHNFAIAETPHQVYDYYLMAPKSAAQLIDDLDTAIAFMRQDPVWLNICYRYRIDDSFLPRA
jgi:ABC-type amino acid transport substrate-binding protein